jgi:hypothetical protein
MSIILFLTACGGSSGGSSSTDDVNSGEDSSEDSGDSDSGDVGSGDTSGSTGSGGSTGGLDADNITAVQASDSDYTGTVYYVSASEGSDSNNGTSSDTPWKTIYKINQASLEPGDAVLFKSGDEWRTPDDTALVFNDSGEQTGVGFEDETFDNYITLGAYGTGDKPRILGSDKVEGWTETDTANIWTASIDYNTYAKGMGGALVFEYIDGSYDSGLYRTSLSDLTEHTEWMYSSNALFVYSESDPDDAYQSIESEYTPKLILLNNMDYIEIEGLELAYSTDMGVYEASNPGTNYGIRVANNYIHHIGKVGSGAGFGLSLKRAQMLIEGNDIHNSGRRNISINLYGSDTTKVYMEDLVIRGNYLHHGHHTTGIDAIISGDHELSNMFIYNNFFEDDKYVVIDSDTGGDYDKLTSNFLYITADPGYVNENVFIFNNIFKNGKGKQVALDGVKNANIFNNTFYGMAQNISISTVLNMVHITDNILGDYAIDDDYASSVVNNVFYNDVPTASPQYATALFYKTRLFYDADSIDYNLYYATAESRERLVNIYSPASDTTYGAVDEVWTMSNFSAWLDFGGYDYDSNSPTPADPKFVDPENSDFTLQADSPAINAGTPVSWITTDYYGNPRDPNTPTLGAVEYQD